MLSSQRMERVRSPIIPSVADWIRASPGTISLGQGVVYFEPPAQALERMESCLAHSDSHKYGPVDGIPLLKQTITDKLRVYNRIRIGRTNRIVVTAGSNMGFYNTLLAISDPGDEVILSHPFYFNHEMAVTMAGCTPVLTPTDINYQLHPDRIEDAITDRTRACVTISPNNPTGAVYPEGTLRAVNVLCRRHKIYHISDEAYEYFVYDNAHHFSPASIDGACRHTISLFSLSKAFGFAGWRIGYMLIPEHLRDAILKIQDTILICPPIVSQYAAVGAMEAGRSFCLEKIRTIAQVRQCVLERLAELGSLIDPARAEGAFYVLLRIHTDDTDMSIVKTLIHEFGVAVIPGSAFGITKDCYLRIAYGALNQSTIADGMDRLVRGLKAILTK